MGNDILRNLEAPSDWKLMVTLREPAERLLSAYLDKCIFGWNRVRDLGSYRDKRRWYQMYKTLCSHDFTTFVERFVRRLENGRTVNYHFMPQHTFCSLTRIYPQLVSDTLIYHRDTMGQSVLEWLTKYQLEEYLGGWGDTGTEQLFESMITHISSHRAEDAGDCQFYGQYYSLETLQSVQDALRKDYDLFQFPDPPWKRCLNVSANGVNTTREWGGKVNGKKRQKETPTRWTPDHLKRGSLQQRKKRVGSVLFGKRESNRKNPRVPALKE